MFNLIEKINDKVRAKWIIYLAGVIGGAGVVRVRVIVYFFGPLVTMFNVYFLSTHKLIGKALAFPMRLISPAGVFLRPARRDGRHDCP